MASTVAGVPLRDGESIRHDRKPTWSLWFWPILLTFGLWVLPAWQFRRRTRYIITDERAVIKRASWLRSRTDEFRLRDVTRVRTKRSLGERILGGGTIVLDTGMDELTLQGVPEYERVLQDIRELQTN